MSNLKKTTTACSINIVDDEQEGTKSIFATFARRSSVENRRIAEITSPYPTTDKITPKDSNLSFVMQKILDT